MSNIVCEAKDPLRQMYVNVLQNKIKEVCSRIGFDDSLVAWHIYEPKIKGLVGKNSVLESVLIGQNGRDFGYTLFERNEIWISTLSIRSDIQTNNEVSRAINNVITLGKRKRELLADVILDEITHIQTGCNHGNKKYDTLLKSNENKYYGKLSELDI